MARCCAGSPVIRVASPVLKIVHHSPRVHLCVQGCCPVQVRALPVQPRGLGVSLDPGGRRLRTDANCDHRTVIDPRDCGSTPTVWSLIQASSILHVGHVYTLLLSSCVHDSDDEVRDRAVLNLRLLESDPAYLSGTLLNGKPRVSDLLQVYSHVTSVLLRNDCRTAGINASAGIFTSAVCESTPEASIQPQAAHCRAPSR